jgi:hypothetical protein
VNKSRIRELFIEVANKVREEIATGTTHKPQPGIVTTSLLVRSGLIFRADVADLFFKNVDEAAELAKQNPAWSKAAIDRIFSEGLSEIADGASVADSVRNFQSKLDRQPEKFRLRFSIFGLGEGCENTDFGKIRIGLDTLTPLQDLGPFFKEGVPMTFHYAEMEVEAADLESAKIRGANLLDRHLALLNILCADGIPTLCFLSRRYSGSMYDFSIHQEKMGEGWSQGMSSSRIRRAVMPSDWKNILGSSHKERFSYLLQSESPFAEHLLIALELAGGTFQEQSLQNAFLLLAVALETALMGGKNEQEITHQFALRAALLSKGTLEGRMSLHKRIKRLYKIRSAIVHRGSKEITDRDLIEMRDVCLGCLMVLCTSSDFSSFKTLEELEAWFLERMLSAPEPAFEIKL